jgi:diguanylate cyclase (GGDEF)-like protein
MCHMSARRSNPVRDRHELEVLHRVAVALSQSLSTSDVLTALTRELVFGIERACECAISLWDEQRDMLIDAAAHTIHGPPAWPRGQVENPLAEYPATRRLLRRGRGWGEYRLSDPSLDANNREVLELWGWRSVIELPLVVEGRSVGLIEVADYRSSRRWSQRDVAFCQTIASQAAMAVRNAQLYEEVQQQADRDSLTELLNHRTFYERLGQELARAQRDGSRVGVITIDLDDFKALNDTRGHLAGDRTLVLVASALRGCSRTSDVAGRLGGDEFALLLPGTGGDIELVARRVLAAISSQAGVTASLGVAVAEPGETDPLLLMAHADRSLLDAKRSGKRTYRLSA